MSSSEAGRESLLFRAGKRLCALPVASVVETMRPLPVDPMAGVPWCVLGLALIRGAPVPVVDLNRLLEGDAGGAAAGAGDESLAAARFVTVRVEGRAIALAVDRVVGVRFLAAETLRDLPPLLRDASGEVIASIGRLDAELMLVLQAARILSSSSMPPALEGTV